MSERNVKLDLEAIWGLVFFTLIALALMAFAGWLVWDWATPDESYEPTYQGWPIDPAEEYWEQKIERDRQGQCNWALNRLEEGGLTSEEYQLALRTANDNCR